MVEIGQVVAEFHLIQGNTFGEGVAKAWPDQNVNMPKTIPRYKASVVKIWLKLDRWLLSFT